jgi:adenylate cyclase
MPETSAKLFISPPNSSSFEYNCFRLPVSIGRAAGSMIVISDERASRSHAKIDQTNNAFFITDLNSRNGTLLNGTDIRKGVPVELRDGDEIRIGSYLLQFHLPVKTDVQVKYDDKPLTGSIKLQNAADLLRPLSLIASGDEVIRGSGSGFTAFKKTNTGKDTELLEAAAAEIEVLAKRSRILGFFYDLNKMLARVFDVEEIYATVAELIFKVSNAGRVMFAKLEDDAPMIEWGRYRDDAVRLSYTGIPVSRTVIRKVITEQVSLLCVDAMSDVNLKDQATFRLGSIRSLMCVPMLGQENTALGAVYVDRTEVFGFTDEDLNFLTVVASNVALTLENINVHEKLMRDAEARAAYRRFLPQHVVDDIMLDPEGLQLGGVNQVVTILFADIRGFTTLAERKRPQEIVELLNTYFERAAAAIFTHHGSLDKFIGDGIMALFGAPKPTDRDPLNAVQAAIALQHVAQTLNRELQEKGSDFSLTIGIGINTGEVTAGYIGSKLRTDYTVIGDPVNLAARLESNAQSGQVLLGENSYQAIKRMTEAHGGSVEPDEQEFALKPVGKIKVKGKEHPVQVYEVFWESGVASPEDENTVYRSGSERSAYLAESRFSHALAPLESGADADASRNGGTLWESFRKEPRLNAAILLKVSGIDAEGSVFEEECQTEDVSQSGARVRIGRELRVGTSVLVFNVEREWRLEATVRSVTLGRDTYLVGIHFPMRLPDWGVHVRQAASEAS